ncbi:hypothetical protein FRB93_013198 [Tulasnella sp. JGI-2019a]|nr:hypothetical protein FRB93_013198 [Tulasnella sp. JGI-2019a]
MRAIPILGTIGLVVLSATPVLSTPTLSRRSSSVHHTDIAHVKRDRASAFNVIFADEKTAFMKIWTAGEKKKLNRLPTRYHDGKAHTIDILKRVWKGESPPPDAAEVEKSRKLLIWFKLAGDGDAAEALRIDKNFLPDPYAMKAPLPKTPPPPRRPGPIEANDSIKNDATHSSSEATAGSKSKTGLKKVGIIVGSTGVIGTAGGITAGEMIGHQSE